MDFEVTDIKKLGAIHLVPIANPNTKKQHSYNCVKPETLSTQIKLPGLSQPGANLSNWGGNWNPETADLSNSTDLHHIKLAYDIHQCYHNLYHRFHNPHTKYPCNCGKEKACSSCHNDGNRRACLRSQPFEFTIHTSKPLLAQKILMHMLG